MRAQRVRYRLPREYPEDHPGRNGPMLVQQYIDTGREPGIYRVLMFLGRPLYAYAIRGVSNAVDLNADDATLESAVIASQAFTGAQREFVAEADVLDIARQADAALPEIPLKGCDVIREAATGRLYILEVNAGGNTWHFSSGYFRQLRRELGSDFVQTMHAQFDAFRTAAAALVERVNSEAE
jgi:glutathione synthase/RimK-type ligase-like ATP-grasp enzyme